ncbi:MAG: FeoB small GTPase domain-containing protein [Nostocaceae cyanobacterium]|nr:FeoB small GTPase domain-containing protein [Nostocaceae cyanobacterium]
MDCHHCPQSCHQKKQKQRGFWGWLRRKNHKEQKNLAAMDAIALLGMPNVGKSVLFSALTGTYVTVSNYPGTTVEITRGDMAINGKIFQVVDTPGMYSLLPITPEEKVARDLLLTELVKLVIHVVDAKNLGRMLPLTFQLIEAGLPVILAINMMDEAENLGIKINRQHLEMELGIPVVIMAAAKGRGVKELTAKVEEYVSKSTCLSPAH